jgi:REP element-mobilizing transposase RayT
LRVSKRAFEFEEFNRKIMKTYSSKNEGYQIRDDGTYFLTLTIVDWVDIFTRNVYKEIVIESLKFCQNKKGLFLNAFVIMSNHLHLIASTPNQHLGQIIGDFKQFTANKIIENLQDKNLPESRRDWLLWHFSKAGQSHSANKYFKIWETDNYPIKLDNQDITKQKLDYLHQNPVRAGWVYRPEDYVYSSASNYVGLQGVLEVEILTF